MFRPSTLAIALSALFACAQAEARLDVSPRSVSFYNTEVGSTSYTQTVRITNYYPYPVDRVSVSSACTMDFDVMDLGCFGPMYPSSSCSIQIRFRPYTAGYKWCSINIRDSFGGFENVNVSGDAVERRRPLEVSEPTE